MSNFSQLPDDLPLGPLVSIIFRYRSTIMNQWLKPYGLSSGQYPILIFLLKHQNITQETMAKKFRIDKGTIARAVKKLEAAGYVTRKLDPKSKRAIRLFPTVKAEEIAQYLFNLDVTWGDKVTSSLTEEEQEHLMTILHKIAYKSLCMSSGPVEIQPEDMQAINNRK